ncbi:MAG TPA: helix-turn-helix transcriptional regulator, partial [Candidatus Acidoferrum sp.]|nr:helix-turn-helix transcriptional regulator [Candidatus Acidoferrum sp.]
MSQAEIGLPLTRGFVSAVERGHVVPSLPSLLHLASRLGVDAAALLSSVNGDATGVYTPAHG